MRSHKKMKGKKNCGHQGMILVCQEEIRVIQNKSIDLLNLKIVTLRKDHHRNHLKPKASHTLAVTSRKKGKHI